LRKWTATSLYKLLAEYSWYVISRKVYSEENLSAWTFGSTKSALEGVWRRIRSWGRTLNH